MTWDERKKVGIFFLCLESNFTQMLFSNVGNFFLSPVGNFFSSRVKFYANLILKCRQFLFILSRKFFPSSQVNFYANVILKCRQFFFISSRKLFPLSRVKFYANAILKCRQFFLSQVGIFFFVSSQILRKYYSQTSAIFLSWVRNFFLRLDLRWRKTFPTWDKKNCRYLRITFA